VKGLWLEDSQITYRTDLPMPEPGPGEAVIKTSLAGICSTDLEMTRGYTDFTGVPGHEFVGVVHQAPQDPGLEGQRVVGEINIVCGECFHCRNGRASHCLNRTALGIHDRNGVFAEYFTLPLENIHPLPDVVPDTWAVFTEPLAAALQIHHQVHVHPGDRVLVVGAGRLGQLAAQTLKLTGCDLRVVARHESQRKILVSQGIPVLPEEEVPAGTEDLVVDATGSPSGFAVSRRAVRSRGTLVMKSTYADELTWDASGLVVDEINLVGSRCGPFPPAIRLLAYKQVNPGLLLDAVYPLEEGLAALEKAGTSGILKVGLAPEGD
jgi:threonine dehydrogenase-like Zn-dependent dehydrogenase